MMDVTLTQIEITEQTLRTMLSGLEATGRNDMADHVRMVADFCRYVRRGIEGK